MTIYGTALDRITVRDAMHTGILTTDPTTPLRVVARLMAGNGLTHVIVNPGTGHPSGTLSSLDVAAAYAG